MEKNEIIEKITAIVKELLKVLEGKSDHITKVRIPVNVDDYFSEKKAPFGCFIENVYLDKVEIMIPRSMISNYSNTVVDLYSKSYSELTKEDLAKLYESFHE